MNIDVRTLKTPTRLAVLLALAGISQSELARRVGTGRQHANRWLAGRAKPSAESYRKIHVALAEDIAGLQLADVMGGDDG